MNNKKVTIAAQHVDNIFYDVQNGVYKITLIEEFDNAEYELTPNDARAFLRVCENYYNAATETLVVELYEDEEDSLEVDTSNACQRKHCEC